MSSCGHSWCTTPPLSPGLTDAQKCNVIAMICTACGSACISKFFISSFAVAELSFSPSVIISGYPDVFKHKNLVFGTNAHNFAVALSVRADLIEEF